ncbi:MAG: hypothetical protein RIQ72_665 [Candidatus Parcubacteria bacterium]|jgi:methyl-accepting chemotaxis protein
MEAYTPPAEDVTNEVSVEEVELKPADESNVNENEVGQKWAMIGEMKDILDNVKGNLRSLDASEGFEELSRTVYSLYDALDDISNPNDDTLNELFSYVSRLVTACEDLRYSQDYMVQSDQLEEQMSALHRIKDQMEELDRTYRDLTGETTSLFNAAAESLERVIYKLEDLR